MKAEKQSEKRFLRFFVSYAAVLLFVTIACKQDVLTSGLEKEYLYLMLSKKVFLILLLAVFATDLAAQTKLSAIKINSRSFPTNINEDNFKTVSSFNGKIVAFDGVIQGIENSRNNTPFYKLKIGGDSYLWTVLMFENKLNKIGDDVRVVGYLIPTEPNEAERKYLDGQYMVIAFGLVDFKNSNLFFLSEATAGKQKAEWIEGKIPRSKK